MNALVPKRPPSIVDVFRQMDEEANRKDPGRPARLERAKQDKTARQAAERIEIIARYGSMDAADVGGEIEQKLRTVSDPFRRKVRKNYSNGTFDIDSLSGWTGYDFGEDAKPVPARVLAAIKRCHPLPITIAEAAAEYMHWRARDKELEIVHRYFDADTMLPLECVIREQTVCDLLQTGLRAQTIEDVLARQRYVIDLGYSAPEIDEAVLADLEHLAAIGRTA